MEPDLLRAAIETDEVERVQVLNYRNMARKERKVAGRVVVRLTTRVEAIEAPREEMLKQF